MNQLIEKLEKSCKKKFAANTKAEYLGETIHPLRLLRNPLLVPLALSFNTNSKSFIAVARDELSLMKSPFEVVEALSKRTPIMVQEIMEGSDTTFSVQVESSISRIYLYKYLFDGGNIESNKGQETEANSIYIPIPDGKLFKFDNKQRYVEGLYLFIGQKVNCFVLHGKPINAIENPKIITIELSDLIGALPDEIISKVNRWTAMGKIISKTIGIEASYLKKGKLNETFKSIASIL